MDNTAQYNSLNIKQNRIGGDRSSNIELLRIISICLVMMLHYIPTRLIPSAESISNNFWEALLNLELRSISFVAVNCFILISGYFQIHWKIRSITSLLYKIIYWTVVSLLLAILLSYILDSEPFLYHGNLLANIFTIRWFIGAYLCLYLVAPILNAFISNTSTRMLGTYILIFYAFTTVFGWLLKSTEYNEGMNALSLSGLYLLGAYIRKANNKFLSFKPHIDLIIYFALGIVLLIVSVISLKAGVNKSVYGYLNPIVIIQSAYLFSFFKKINIGHIRIINVLAASAFSVYLFHTDICIRPFWYELCDRMNAMGPYVSLLVTLFIYFTIFIVCVCLDYFGNFGLKPIINLLDKNKS